jgi:hypothetical protein
MWLTNLDNEHRAARDLHMVPKFEILQEAYSLQHTYMRVRFEANVFAIGLLGRM